MTPPRVVMLSFWRNDVARGLTERAAHLLDKTYPNLDWVWVVGDSADGTDLALMDVTESHPRGWACSTLDLGDTGIPGDEPNVRLHRLSVTAQMGLNCIPDDADYVCIHESDIQSPPDLVERLLAVGKDVVGGWPVLGAAPVFYDTWAYRGLDGEHFTNHPPYHPDYQMVTPFEVQSVGTVWLFPAAAVRAGLRCTTFGCVELCRGLREQGYRIWCDPRLEVVQPMALWTAQRFPTEVAV
jgi:hypothetical protein